MWFWIIGLLFVAVVVASLVKRGFEFKRLAHEGVRLTATVILKVTHAKQQSVHYIKYRYTTPDGQTFEHKSNVTRDEYDQYEEGDPFEIVYVPSAPRISGPRNVVNQSREALNLPPI